MNSARSSRRLASTATGRTPRASNHYVFKGAYSDTAPYPAEKCTDPDALEFGQLTCVTDAQVREQLQSFIASHGTPKGMNAVYYLLTPPGVAVCLDEASTSCSDFKLTPKEISRRRSQQRQLQKQLLQLPRRDQPRKSARGERQHDPLRGDPVDRRLRGAAVGLRPRGEQRGPGLRLPGRRLEPRRTRRELRENPADDQSGRRTASKKRHPKKKRRSNRRGGSRARTSRSPTRWATAGRRRRLTHRRLATC